MLAALALPLLAASSLAASVCNGDAALCDRKYSNVTFIGAHNSYAVGQSPADNQNKNVTAQLNDGVRALQVQAHNLNGTIELCHTSCSLRDGGSLQAYLESVNSWMSSNPNEVVTMFMVNSDNLPASQFASAFEAAGISNKAYKPDAASLTVSQWPTLGSLIDAGTTLVAFIDNQADFTNYPYIIDEWSSVWEDAYDVTDQTFGCAVNRTKGQPDSQMYMINHFLDQSFSLLGTQILTPNTAKLNETNAATGDGSIGFHVDNCLMLYGRAPSIILLDFYDAMGSAPFDAAATFNGIAAPSTTVTPYTQTAAATATGDSGSATQPSNVPNAQISQSRIGNGAGRTGASVAVGVLAASLALLI